MRPINEWIVVEEIKEEEISAGGIVMPGKEKKLLLVKSKVLDISPDIASNLRKEEKEIGFKIGDTVLHHKQVGLKIDPSDKSNNVMWMKHESVMGVESSSDVQEF